MNVIDLLLGQLDREVKRSHRALEMMPEDKRSWKPHQKSMEFGYLSDMVATIPSWMVMMVKQDELDVAPKNGSRMERPQLKTRADYTNALEQSAREARAALHATTEEHLNTHWKMLAGGKVVAEVPRLQMLQDTLSHWAHHRGQMTVYLRLMDAKVPALYGPSADDNRFD